MGNPIRERFLLFLYLFVALDKESFEPISLQSILVVYLPLKKSFTDVLSLLYSLEYLVATWTFLNRFSLVLFRERTVKKKLIAFPIACLQSTIYSGQRVYVDTVVFAQEESSFSWCTFIGTHKCSQEKQQNQRTFGPSLESLLF